MQSLYGPTQAASRFADWVGTAYDAPTYQPYSPGAPWQQQTAASLGAQPTYESLVAGGMPSPQAATAALASTGGVSGSNISSGLWNQPSYTAASSMGNGSVAYDPTADIKLTGQPRAVPQPTVKQTDTGLSSSQALGINTAPASGPSWSNLGGLMTPFDTSDDPSIMDVLKYVTPFQLADESASKLYDWARGR